MKPCPCKSPHDFSDCCEPYLLEKKMAETPEILMRSRYTAYTLGRTDYIVKTMRKKAAENYDENNARQRAFSVEWLGLTVINAPAFSEQYGTVTFLARFSEQNIKKYIYEQSDFEKINGEWFYTGGVTPKINRNETCPCGSGKKSKKCCF